MKTDGLEKDKYKKLQVYEAIAKLDFVAKAMPSVRDLKKAENGSLYEVLVILKDNYYDGTLNLEKLSGMFLQFVQEHNIKTMNDFAVHTLPMMKNMNDFIHTLKNFKEKKSYRSIKHSYVKFLYNKGLVQRVYEQTSYCTDTLVGFESNGYTFHLRKEACDFLSEPVCGQCGSPSMEKVDAIFQKRVVSAADINMDFLKYEKMLSQVNSSQLFSLVSLN